MGIDINHGVEQCSLKERTCRYFIASVILKVGGYVIKQKRLVDCHDSPLRLGLGGLGQHGAKLFELGFHLVILVLQLDILSGLFTGCRWDFLFA